MSEAVGTEFLAFQHKPLVLMGAASPAFSVILRCNYCGYPLVSSWLSHGQGVSPGPVPPLQRGSGTHLAGLLFIGQVRETVLSRMVLLTLYTVSKLATK